MKVNVYNQKGEEIGTTLLPKEIFEVKLNQDLVYQVVLAQTANKRKNIAHTKDRSEVRGGGKKPWRQKGTGRARHGSRRSPLWKGGGVTFGPRKDKIFKKKINRKIRKKALFMVLTEKLKNDLLFFLDKIKLEKTSTKEMAGIIKNLKTKLENFKTGKTLIVLPEIDKNLILSIRNLPKIKTIQARELNALNLLENKYLIITKDSIKIIKETFLK